MPPSLPDHALAQRQHKKHKPVPRPRSHRRLDDEPDARLAADAPPAASAAASHHSMPRALKHESRTIVTAPTPDVTPPGPALRPNALHPAALDRGLSKTASTGSPMESFETAREEPSSSDDQRGDFLASAPKSRLLDDSRCNPVVSPPDLRSALERVQIWQTDSAHAHARRGLSQSDAIWTASPATEREWTDSMARPTKRVGFEHRDAGDKTIAKETFTKTRPVRQTTLRDAPIMSSSPKHAPLHKHASSAPSNSDTSIHTDAKRLSGQSIKSNPSTVVEAILVDLPPRRQRTLRHVQKRGALREPTDRFPAVRGPSFDLPRSVLSGDGIETRNRVDVHGPNVSNSATSVRARRESWESGSIPVVVVPERRSSSKGRSTKEHALRSTSGRRSRRATSPDPGIAASTLPEPEYRRGRQRREPVPDYSEDMRVDPSLTRQAPSMSLSEDRLGVRRPQPPNLGAHAQEPSTAGSPEPQQSPLPEISIRLEPEEVHELAGLGRHEDAFSSKKFSSRETPFSIASFETSGTAPEVSEAMAVQMFPHQNSSVLVVNHLAKPAEATETVKYETRWPAQPTIRKTSPDGRPATPPGRDSLDEVDSPLRNPRRPPTPPAQPPAINFIPATPSGSTPAQERLVRQGNYFDATVEPPARRPSIVRRALGRRRHSVDYPPTAAKAPGLITRTLSLSRNVRHLHSTDAAKGSDAGQDAAYPRKDAVPAEGNKLHPFWRPQPHEDARLYGYDYAARGYDAVAAGLSRGSPGWAASSRAPKRSLSARMKRTFAIFPIRDDELLPAETSRGPELCTIRRTPSGNLRVMRRRASVDSYLRHESIRGATHGVPDAKVRQSLWGGGGLRQGPALETGRRWAVGRRWEGIQRLPRRLSERRREKRTRKLRQMISGPKDVRDGVREVIEPRGPRAPHQSDGYGLI